MDKSSERKSYGWKITSSAYSQENSFLPLTCTQRSQKRSSGFKAFNRAFGYFLQVSLLRRTDEPQYRVPEQLWTVTAPLCLSPSLIPTRPRRLRMCRHLSSLSGGCLGPTSVVFIACKDIFYVTSHAESKTLSTIRFADLCSTYWVHVRGSEMVH